MFLASLWRCVLKEAAVWCLTQPEVVCLQQNMKRGEKFCLRTCNHPNPTPIWHLSTHPRSMMSFKDKNRAHSEVWTHLMCLWNADGKHLNMKNHCHHHRHYHHYYPHDAVAAGRSQITKWLQTRWLRDERWRLKRGQEKRRGGEEWWRWEWQETWQKHETQGTQREEKKTPDMLWQKCVAGGWSDDRREGKSERKRGISVHLKATGEQKADVGKWAMRQL